MVNIRRLNGTMRHILTHPHQHKQNLWIENYPCGTSACFAGWAALLYGPEEGWFPSSLSPTRFEKGSKGWLEIPEVAAEILDIDDDEAFDLFDSGNTIEDLQRIVNSIVSDE